MYRTFPLYNNFLLPYTFVFEERISDIKLQNAETGTEDISLLRAQTIIRQNISVVFE
jgi:hypothetical protein